MHVRLDHIIADFYAVAGKLEFDSSYRGEMRNCDIAKNLYNDLVHATCRQNS